MRLLWHKRYYATINEVTLAYALLCHYNWCYSWYWALLCHAAHLARQFWDNCKSLANYIRRRTQLCNTLCSLDILVFRPRIWSLLPIHSVRPKAAQLDLVLDCILRLSHLRLSAIPSSALHWSSRLRLSHLQFSVRLRLLYSMLVYVFQI